MFLIAGAAAIVASYMAVIFGLAPSPGFGSSSVASVAFPALVSGLVMASFIAFESKRSRSEEGLVHELHAQLAKKEIEIGRLASVDDLTGLYTRHHFDENLNAEYARTSRHGRPLSVLLIEIDDLEGVGEQAGALSKGYLLSEVGGLLRNGVRINDVACRYSTHQLAILLPETDATGVRSTADRLRAALADREFLTRRQGAGFRLTVSQGSATIPSAQITTHIDMLHVAEAALGEARLAGTDQVRVIEPIAVPAPEPHAAA